MKGVDTSPSEADFARARRAVALGLATEAAVEAALLAADRGEHGPEGVVGRLGLSSAQRLALEGGPLPAEVAAALHDPGRAFAHFVLLEVLGRGGMGVVHRAWDLRLGRFVALKALRRLDDGRARRLFEREARLAAGLAIPQVAAIHELGEHEGRPFISMQLIEGETFARAGRGGDPRRAAALVRDAARVVEEAHRRGVVHRDLKPANLMLDAAGRVVVLDFGLARPAVADAGATGTASEVIAGTPEYMAPEQARGGEGQVDARADVHALGACLFDLLVGRPPFASADRGEVIAQVLRDPPPRPRALAPAVPPALEAVVLRCLEKDPARRYPSAGALADDLDRFLAGAPVEARGRRRGRRLAAAALALLVGAGAATAGRSDGATALAPVLIHREGGPADITALAVEQGRVYFGRALPAAPGALPACAIGVVPAAGGAARLLFDVPDIPTGLVAHSGTLFWCDMNSAPPEGGSRVYRRAPDGDEAPFVLYSGAPTGTTLEDASGLAAHGRLLLAVDQVGGSVFRLSSFLPGEAERVAGPRYPGGFAAEHHNAIAVCDGAAFVADLGFANVTQPGVFACPVEGGPFRALHIGPPLVRPRGVAASFDAVYVVDPGAGDAVFVLPPGGGSPRRLLGGAPFVDVTAVATDGQALFVADSGNRRGAQGETLEVGPASIYRIDLAPRGEGGR
ncbi:MAG: serine/threonine-protein kinase [Planctomycetes bacterium]|nr:serine/threonine-protein kinase [Planctomycetota bacterium]